MYSTQVAKEPQLIPGRVKARVFLLVRRYLISESKLGNTFDHVFTRVHRQDSSIRLAYKILFHVLLMQALSVSCLLPGPIAGRTIRGSATDPGLRSYQRLAG